jgi:predicted O-methyltransferase YrrM
MFLFPQEKPAVKADSHGWFDDHLKSYLKPIIKNDMKMIIELGSWLGSSTRWFCENSNAKVVAIDHWKGSIEHVNRRDVKDKLPTLYETFIVNCWDYRDRITPVKMDTISGLTWCSDMGFQPDIIFIDASHEYEDVLKDLETSHNLFPKAILVGDDWAWRNRRLQKRFTVREAVVDFCKKKNFKVADNTRCWHITKE